MRLSPGKPHPPISTCYTAHRKTSLTQIPFNCLHTPCIQHRTDRPPLPKVVTPVVAAVEQTLPAIACMVGAVAFLTASDSLIKSLTDVYPVGQLLFVRSIFVWPWIFIFAYRRGGLSALRINSVKGHGLRGLLVIASTFLFVTGLYYLPLATAIAAIFMGPLFITAMAPFVLGERVGWRRWLAVSIGFFGVLVMVRPGTDAFQWAIMFPIAGAMCGGLRDLITRRISQGESTLAMLGVTTIVIMLAGVATIPFGWSELRTTDIAKFALSGTLVTAGHYLMIDAFRRGEAGLVAPFKYTSLLWAILIGYIAFGELPDRWTLMGATVIISAGLYVFYRETQLRRTAIKPAR
jgi:drug/metabolite transporter (DMT)-like permease